MFLLELGMILKVNLDTNKRGEKVWKLVGYKQHCLDYLLVYQVCLDLVGTSVGNYTLGRPLVGGLVCGIILGDIATGILVGVAMQVVYIALVTPGGTVSADVRAVSYIGIPLAMIAIKSYGLDAASADGAAMVNFIWNNGWNFRNSFILWNSNN